MPEDNDWLDEIVQPTANYAGSVPASNVPFIFEPTVKTVLNLEELTCINIDRRVKQEQHLAESFPDTETAQAENTRTERVRKVILDKSLESLRQYKSAASTVGKNTENGRLPTDKG